MESILLALLVLCVGAYIAARMADRIQQRPGPPEPRLVSGPSVERLQTATIRPLTQTTLPEQRTREPNVTGFPPRQVPQPPAAPTETASVKGLVDEWRRSVVLLVKWGQRNMNDARLRLEVEDYRSALDKAFTGVERMARALLHCFGEKADLDSGQTEPLRLVSLRLTGDERAEFEAAVETAERLHQNVKAQKFLSTQKTDVELLDAQRAMALVDSASKVVTAFTKILHERFAAELPDLQECCPRCFSIDVTVWAFNDLKGSYTCNLCRHKWVE